MESFYDVIANLFELFQSFVGGTFWSIAVGFFGITALLTFFKKEV